MTRFSADAARDARWFHDEELVRECALDDPSDRWLEIFRDAQEEQDRPMTTVAGYDILSEIGRGGQGVVYRARRQATGEFVAIKRLHADRASMPGARRRLDRERETVELLEHPAIVRPVACTPEELEPAIILEWVDGVPISEWARGGAGGRRGRDERSGAAEAPPPPRAVSEVVRVFLGVCDALEHAHQRGVIHRDLKPSNVLVQGRKMGAGVVFTARILDFGLASHRDRPAGSDGATTTEGRFVGTPLHASPEQVLGRTADARSDIYSLGLLLHKCLTGALPYGTDGPMIDVLHRIVHEPARRASAAGRAVGRDLEAVLLRALEKEPGRRHQSVESFRADLLAVLEDRPVSARLASPWYRARKLAARHRLITAGLGLAAGLIAAAVVISTTLAVRLERERRQAAAVARFLQETLSSARPGRGGAGATVLDAVAAAERRAELELADEPAVALEVFQAIGETYRSLWKFEAAIPPLRRAVELARRVHGDRSDPVARALTTLGHCVANTSGAEAVELQREALAIRLRLHRGDHRLVAESHMRLGYALYRAIRPPDRVLAEHHLRAAIDMSRRLDDPLGAAQGLHNLGYLCWAGERLPEAVAMYEEALGLLEENGGAPAGATAAHAYVELLTGYASLLSRVDRAEESAAAYARLVPILRRDFPDEALAPSLRRLASLHMTLGRADAAAPVLEELLAIQVRLRGAGSTEAQAVRAELEQLGR